MLLPGVAAYFLMTQYGIRVQIGAMLAGMGMLYLNLLFFQSLTLMLGAFFNSRRAVIGISLAPLFLLNQLTQMSFGAFLPGHLPLDAATVMASQPYTNLVSLVETAALTVIFIGLALWRFEREEF